MKRVDRFYVVKLSAGYAVKTFNNESEARKVAALCCKANSNKNYSVCTYDGINFNEI